MAHGSPALPRERRDSLATKILLFVAVSTFLTGLTVSAFSVRSIYTSLRRDAEARLPGLAQAAAHELEPLVGEARQVIERLAKARTSRATLGSAGRAGDPGRSRLERVLGQALDVDGPFDALALVSRDGQVLARAAEPEAPAFAPVTPQELPNAVALAALDTEAGLALAAASPIPGRGTQPAGYLYGRLRTGPLQEALRRAVLGATGEVYLLDALGRVVIAGPYAAPTARPASLLLSLAPDASPLGVVHAASGERLLAAQRSLEAGAWRVVAAQPTAEVFAPAVDAVRRLAFINVALGLLFMLIAYRITGAILRPIEALYRAAHRVSEGDLEVLIPVASSTDEIGLLTQTFNDMTRRLSKSHGEIESAYARVREQNEELQRANEVLAQLSITDGLTKLHNHRWFQDCLTREIKRVTRSGDPLAMLLVDIDDFKALNDRLGHAAGDELLVRIARTLNESVRETDLLARYGGEEFVVLAVGTDLPGAVALGEKIRTAVAEASFILDESMRPCRVTVSVGVAAYRGNRREFFRSADQALYRAKAEGKNCVVADDVAES